MNLKTHCLGVTPMSPEAAQVICDMRFTVSREHLQANVQKLALSHERLRAELDGAASLQLGAEQQLAEFLEMNAGMKEGFSERLSDIQNEIKSVLMLMDGLAEQWGDEGVFRRCRDRLRSLAESM